MTREENKKGVRKAKNDTCHSSVKKSQSGHDDETQSSPITNFLVRVPSLMDVNLDPGR